MPQEDLSARASAWWAVPAFFASLVAPVAVARRSARVPLWAAWFVHIAGLVTWFVAVVGVDVWVRSRSFSSWWRRFSNEFDHILNDALDPVVWVYLGVTLLAIEGGVTVLVWGLMSWGARPERVTDSFLRTLCRVWLITPFAVTVFLVLWGGAVVGVERHAPFDWRTRAIVGMALLVLGAAAAFWIVLRAISADWHQGRDACRWPPGCETCGYTILGSVRQATCPECGVSIAQSLADNPRHGTPWARRRQIGRVRAWLTTTAQAIFRPARLGQSLQVLTPDTGRGPLLAVNLTLIFAITGFLIPLLMTLVNTRQYRHIEFDFTDTISTGCSVALVMTTVALGWLLLSSSLVATLLGARAKRNLLPAAMQASCCLGGLLALWIVVVWAVYLVLIWLHRSNVLEIIADRMGIVDEELIPVAVFGVTILLGLANWLGAHGRIVRAARYANR